MYNFKTLFGAVLLISTLFLGCSSNNGNDGNGSNFSSTQDVGDSANDFLSSSNYNSLIIEIDYVEGFQPTQTALNNLRSFLQDRLNKTTISISLDDEIPSPGNSPYSPQEAYDIEKEHRNTYTEGSTIAAYFLILDGQFEQENVLGFAYFNTSMALLGGTIANNSGGFSQPSRETVETTVLQHEFGHILGLVGNGTPTVQDHQDEANGAHCDVDTCLMYFAVRTSDFVNNLMGGNVPELDSQCIQDLQANGGK
ncbi:peptidase [bacterium]|nr:peptidase [bacterium]